METTSRSVNALKSSLLVILNEAFEHFESLNRITAKRRRFIQRLDNYFAPNNDGSYFIEVFHLIKRWLEDIRSSFINEKRQTFELYLIEKSFAAVYVALYLRCRFCNEQMKAFLDETNKLLFDANAKDGKSKGSKPRRKISTNNNNSNDDENDNLNEIIRAAEMVNDGVSLVKPSTDALSVANANVTMEDHHHENNDDLKEDRNVMDLNAPLKDDGFGGGLEMNFNEEQTEAQVEAENMDVARHIQSMMISEDGTVCPSTSYHRCDAMVSGNEEALPSIEDNFHAEIVPGHRDNIPFKLEPMETSQRANITSPRGSNKRNVIIRDFQTKLSEATFRNCLSDTSDIVRRKSENVLIPHFIKQSSAQYLLALPSKLQLFGELPKSKRRKTTTTTKVRIPSGNVIDRYSATINEVVEASREEYLGNTVLEMPMDQENMTINPPSTTSFRMSSPNEVAEGESAAKVGNLVEETRKKIHKAILVEGRICHYNRNGKSLPYIAYSDILSKGYWEMTDAAILLYELMVLRKFFIYIQQNGELYIFPRKTTVII